MVLQFQLSHAASSFKAGNCDASLLIPRLKSLTKSIGGGGRLKDCCADGITIGKVLPAESLLSLLNSTCVILIQSFSSKGGPCVLWCATNCLNVFSNPAPCFEISTNFPLSSSYIKVYKVSSFSMRKSSGATYPL